jgi:hypothetical protein
MMLNAPKAESPLASRFKEQQADLASSWPAAAIQNFFTGKRRGAARFNKQSAPATSQARMSQLSVSLGIIVAKIVILIVVIIISSRGDK